MVRIYKRVCIHKVGASFQEQVNYCRYFHFPQKSRVLSEEEQTRLPIISKLEKKPNMSHL